MKKSHLAAIFATCITMLSCSQKDIIADYEIVPLPSSIELKEGKPFVLNSKTKIIHTPGDKNLERVAHLLAGYVSFLTHLDLEIETGAPAKSNYIFLDNSLQHENAEAYKLTVLNDAVMINGSSSAGTFYGVQTLQKSIGVAPDHKIKLPQVEIEDYPEFGYRGLHLDVARHMYSMDFIKEFIDIMALHNMNTFHWHLTDDQGWRIEIKKYPLLTEKGSQRNETVIGRNSGKYDGTPYGGFYTQDEAREIVAYSKDRFIEIIPEIDLPGHMLAALNGYPELGCTGGPYEVGTLWGVFDYVLCAGNPETLTFLENVLTEIINIFPYKYIHIGGDECPKVRWEECPKCQAKIKELGLKSDSHHTAEQKLQSYITSHVEKFLNGRDRQIIGWDEILEGGLAPNATVMSWRGVQGGYDAAKHGNDAIMVPVSHLYFDYYQTTDLDNVPLSIGNYIPLEKVYSFDPIPDGLTTEEEKHILGLQANLWSEYLTTHKQVEYMLMPRVDALTELQWNHNRNKDYKRFTERLRRMIDYYDLKGYNYSKTMYDINADYSVDYNNRKITAELSTIDNCPIYYTLDGSEPTKDGVLYSSPIVIDNTTNLKAIANRSDSDKVTTLHKEFNFNLASFKPITASETSEKYSYDGARMLVNTMHGDRYYFQDGQWLGFRKDEVLIEIDLETMSDVSSVSVTSFVKLSSWIFGIESITIDASVDGDRYQKIAQESYNFIEDYDSFTQFVKTDRIKFPSIKARYIRVIIKNRDALAEWTRAKGKAFVFLDEIRVE